MGEAAGRAAAEGKADDRPADAAESYLLAIGAPTLQSVQHRNPPNAEASPYHQTRHRCCAPPYQG
ncbi:hypothetical protein GCM10007858_35570 [Bradyrhizobium liaoningense]|nr:hypothetical protein GCM10007858_35570 [Bradyrhizobium liaoningense]